MSLSRVNKYLSQGGYSEIPRADDNDDNFEQSVSGCVQVGLSFRLSVFIYCQHE